MSKISLQHSLLKPLLSLLVRKNSENSCAAQYFESLMDRKFKRTVFI